MADTKVTFVSKCVSRQAVKVFYGPTDGYCVDKPLRSNFSIEPGGNHLLDVGPDPICYCYNDESLGVPPEDCGHQIAKPGETVQLT